ncbi:MAG: hypothetical protein WCJ30_12960, partial [Deltaproteobacteria bacterium]
GSIVALTYVPPGTLAFAPGIETFLMQGARLIREPVYGVIATAAMHALMERHGFAMQEDTATRDWAARFWPAGEARRMTARERLLVATVKSAAVQGASRP